MQDGGLIDSS